MLSCVSDIPCDDNFYDVLSIPVASGNNMQCKNNPRCTHLQIDGQYLKAYGVGMLMTREQAIENLTAYD